MEKKEWKKNILMAVIIVIGVIGYIAGFNEKTVKTSVQSGIAEEILRFHVIANSDSKEDQELKMKVKEEIVSYVSLLTEGEEDVHKAEYIISLYLEEIQKKAEEVIKREGYDYSVTVELTDSYFPVKTYGEAVFPEGIYRALKINIGKAEGKNWWCVLYPNLCFVDSAYGVLEEDQKEQLKSVLTEEEYESIFQVPSKDIKVSFKLFSILE